MKLLKQPLAILGLVAVLFSSCQNDDPQSPEVPKTDINSSEKEAIDIETLKTGIKIDGATVNDGMPAAPTLQGDITFQSTSVQGLQDGGFDLKISSSEDIAGAYMVLKDEGGNPDDQYYDIPLSLNDDLRIGKKRNRLGGNNDNARIEEEEEYEINVSFNNIPAGSFCADVCLYDQALQVYQIVEVCIEVEAWGGLNELVGNWSLNWNKSLDAFSDTDTYTCNGEEKEYVTTEDDIAFNFSFDANGDFELDIQESWLDYYQSELACANILTHDHYLMKGKWAYNEDTDQIILLIYEEVDYNDPDYSEVYEDPEILFYEDESFTINDEGDLVYDDNYELDPFTITWSKD